ncbi:MAG: SMP-30/gluconolactonase/LRE family protein [Nitrososphaeraceae archaeon]
MVIRTKHLLYIVVPAFAVSILLLIFFLNSSNDSDFLPVGEERDNDASLNQKMSNTQPKGQNDVDDDDYYLRGAVSSTSEGKQVQEKNLINLCGGSFEKRTDFIREYTLPFPCSQPVGITVQQQEVNGSNTENNQRIWIAATWMGYLVIFDPNSQSFSDFIEIPNWKTKGEFGSMVWDMKFDKKGDLWFTDQVNNAIWRYFPTDKRFEMYKVPTNGSYPSSIAFDSQGRVWFSEIFGKKLGIIDPVKASNGTSDGIQEYQLNLSEEEGFETMGPLIITNGGSNNDGNSNRSETVWFTAVDFPDAGHVIKFDINQKKFEVLRLAKGVGVPVGIVEDDKERLWINDHATNLFFMFEPQTGKVIKYSTSLPTSRNSTTTLPYYNMYKDGKLWFNEHEGNAIAYFDPANSTLVEYQIPSRGEAWGNTSNPLQFTLDNNGSTWFTEWTENKFGVLDSEKAKKIPLWISIPENSTTMDLDKEKDRDGKSIKIFVYPNRSNIDEGIKGEPVKMTVAGTMSHTGKLWNLTGQFSEEEFYFSEGGTGPQIVTLKLTPDEDLVPGSYMLTVGARYDTVTYSKMVNLNVK